MSIEQAECHDCGLDYGATGWADFVVPDDVWTKISPTEDEGGILCVNCILRRLDEHGIKCEGKMTSGPCVVSQGASDEQAEGHFARHFNTDIEQDALDLYGGPFRNDEFGSIYDARNKLVAIVFPDGSSELKEESARLCALALTEYWEKHNGIS